MPLLFPRLDHEQDAPKDHHDSGDAHWTGGLRRMQDAEVVKQYRTRQLPQNGQRDERRRAEPGHGERGDGDIGCTDETAGRIGQERRIGDREPTDLGNVLLLDDLTREVRALRQHRNLGIHSGLFSDALMELMRKGAVVS